MTAPARTAPTMVRTMEATTAGGEDGGAPPPARQARADVPHARLCWQHPRPCQAALAREAYAGVPHCAWRRHLSTRSAKATLPPPGPSCLGGGGLSVPTIFLVLLHGLAVDGVHRRLEEGAGKVASPSMVPHRVANMASFAICSS
jgi:hypothetical protein